jgi:hypothetical protein
MRRRGRVAAWEERRARSRRCALTPVSWMTRGNCMLCTRGLSFFSEAFACRPIGDGVMGVS